MFPDFGGFGGLFKQAQEIGSRIRGLSDELRNRRVKGSAGGGMVEIEMNGLVQVVRCSIDPSLVAGGDRELLEELVASAVNQAVDKAKQLHAESLREMTGGIPLPGLEQALTRFLSPGSADDEGRDLGEDESGQPPLQAT